MSKLSRSEVVAALWRDCERSIGRECTVRRVVGRALSVAGFRAVVFYRFAAFLEASRAQALGALVERLSHHATHTWISRHATIGAGFVVRHVGCVVVGGRVEIGRDCDIRQGVTIGGNYGRRSSTGRTQPRLGDRVSLGAGAIVLGPIKVGSDVIIGANSVVTRNVPARAVGGGIPFQILWRTPSNSEQSLSEVAENDDHVSKG